MQKIGAEITGWQTLKDIYITHYFSSYYVLGKQRLHSHYFSAYLEKQIAARKRKYSKILCHKSGVSATSPDDLNSELLALSWMKCPQFFSVTNQARFYWSKLICFLYKDWKKTQKIYKEKNRCFTSTLIQRIHKKQHSHNFQSITFIFLCLGFNRIVGLRNEASFIV